MKSLYLVISVLFVLKLNAQTAVFPSLSGADLNGKTIVFPPANGKNTVLAIAFSRQAGDDLRRWLNPLYETFVMKDKNSGGLGSAEVYDVNFYFIPLISGFKKFADEFRNNTDKEFWQYIVDTEKTDIRAVEKRLDIKDDSIPYFFVLDKNGKILETQSGTFQSPKLDKLEDALD